MSDDQLPLFPDIPPTPRKPKSPVVPDVQASPPEVTSVKAASTPKQQAVAAKAPAKKRHKGRGKASAKPLVSSASSELLTVQEVARHCTVSRATIWRWVKTLSGFPQPLRLAPGTTRWRLQDVLAWQANCGANRPEGGSQ